MTSHRYANALSLAAQATVCFSKNIPVISINLDDNTATTEIAGHCIHALPKHWRDNVWVTLSAPVALATHEGRGKNCVFKSCDLARYQKALNLCRQHVAPCVPDQIKSYLMFDTQSKVTDILNGVYPKDAQGTVKGALTRYSKEYRKAEEFAEQMLSDEIDGLFNHVAETSSFMTCTYLLGEQIHSKGKLTHREAIKIYRDAIHTIELWLDSDLDFDFD